MSEGSREPPMEQEVRTAPASSKSNKKKKYDYNEQLKQDFGRIFEALTLTNLQKEFLRSRWLDQVLWMEGRAAHTQKRYYCLRLLTIIGGVLLPALVSWNVSIKNPNDRNNNNAEIFSLLTLALSSGVAVSAAVEEFFHYGERWRHYRRTAESLKTQGWQFSQLSGLYSGYESHQEAFPSFAAQVENILQRDVEVYVTEVVREKEKEQKHGEHELIRGTTLHSTTSDSVSEKTSSK